MDVSDQGGVPRARSGGEQRVTPLELFFDLVFVFALTQVTGFLSHHLTWRATASTRTRTPPTA